MINWNKIWEIVNIISVVLNALEVKPSKKKGKRKNFTKKTKSRKKKLENNRCEKCGVYDVPLEFDHKDGDRSNNHISNCELLCPNCHAKKTRKGAL